MEKRQFVDDPVKKYGYYNFLPDALEELENDDDIVIVPPEPHYLTDEEEFDENQLMVDNIPQDVPGRLEVFRQPPQDDDYCSSDEEPLSEVRKRLKVTRPISDVLEWDKIDPNYSKWPDSSPLSEFNGNKDKLLEEMKNLTPVKIFELILDDTIIQYIVDQSILYASQNNRHNFTTTKEEMKTFFGILFLRGITDYHKNACTGLLMKTWGLEQFLRRCQEIDIWK